MSLLKKLLCVGECCLCVLSVVRTAELLWHLKFQFEACFFCDLFAFEKVINKFIDIFGC